MRTFEHEPFTFPSLKQVNQRVGRVYRVLSGEHTGEEYPSITRVLGARPKPQLAAWKKRVGRTEAARITTESTSRGTKLHLLAESYINNEADQVTDALSTLTDDVQQFWGDMCPWLDEHVQRVHGQESDMYSARLKVAGRVDLLATVDGDLAVVDFKTSRRPKKRDYVLDYFLQGCFYSLCVFEHTGLKVKRIIFPIVSPEGLEVFETTPSAEFKNLRKRIDEYYLHYHTS
jgi:hypothetical protein